MLEHIRRLALVVSVLTAIATSTIAGTHLDRAAGLASCDGVVRPTAQAPRDPEQLFCSAAVHEIGHLRAGQAAVVSGALTVDDAARRLDEGERAFLNVQVRCSRQADGASGTSGQEVRPAFQTDAVRNVWTGMPRTTIHPLGVLVARTAGDYGCVLDARQYDVSTGTRPRSWAIAGATLTATVAAHGASTPGPQEDAWPRTVDDLTSVQGPVRVDGLVAHPARGTRSVRIAASVPISTCAYHSPDTTACWPVGAAGPDLSTAEPFTATLRLTADQQVSRTDQATCGRPLVVDEPADVDAVEHHSTVSVLRTVRLDPRCSGPLVVTTVLEGVHGRGYVGTAGPAPTDPGRAFQDSIGVTWR